jgi:hypothetical protein
MNQTLFKKILPHLIALGVIIVVMLAYFSPLMGGKALKQHDITQWRASYEEVHKFQTETGERTFWTNSMFAGMPIFLIGPEYHYNIADKTIRAVNSITGHPLDTIVFLYVCFYIFLITYGVSPWFAIIGSLAFTFSSFNFLNIDAGHAGKGNAIAFMPLVLAGVKITLGKHKLAGAALTGIAVSLQLAAAHLQISYYLSMVIGVWMIYEIIMAFREKTMRNLLISGCFLLVSAALGASVNITNLLATQEYGKYSIRGPSELTKTADGKAAEAATDGLDKDYALQWSHGFSEPFTLLIPNFMGGGNMPDQHTQSIMAAEFKSAGLQQPKELAQSLPSYFGELPFTSGPIYFGAIICFLFVLGMFLVKDNMKWWILFIATLTIFLSMGKHFMSLTDLFFYHFPLYNKFRSVNFITVVAQTLFPFLGILAIRDIMNGKLKKQEMLKGLYYSFAITGGLCLLFALMPGLAETSSEPLDSQLKQYGYPLDVVIAAREKVRQMDSLRSLFFIALAFGSIWLFITGKLKQQYFALILGALVLIDLWGVDKRYLNDQDYEKRKKPDAVVVPMTSADEIILRDKDPNYRVYNTTQRLDQDAMTSYYHKSIGGYHGAKMHRYQELIEFQMSRRNMEVFNMLNVKYFIIADSLNNLFPQLNENANGNAWFVKEYVMVDNADAEMDSLNSFNSKEKCFIDKRFSEQLNGFVINHDSAATIKLTKYQPNKIVYESNTSSPQLAVFSELYYDKGWDAYIDGEPAQYFRTDYTLRGMKVPAGKHTIEYRFDPKVVKTGETITLVSAILLYGGVAALALAAIFRRKKETE